MIVRGVSLSAAIALAACLPASAQTSPLDGTLGAATPVAPAFSLGAEITVFAVFIVGFVLFSILVLKARYRDQSAWHVNLGAAIYGAIFGALFAFIILPMRVALMGGGLSPNRTALAGFGLIFLMIALRRGLIGKLPFLGPQVKAFRRAMLRRTIEGAQRSLDKMLQAGQQNEGSPAQ